MQEFIWGLSFLTPRARNWRRRLFDSVCRVSRGHQHVRSIGIGRVSRGRYYWTYILEASALILSPISYHLPTRHLTVASTFELQRQRIGLSMPRINLSTRSPTIKTVPYQCPDCKLPCKSGSGLTRHRNSGNCNDSKVWTTVHFHSMLD